MDVDPPQTKLRVLLVEDSLAARSLVMGYLSEAKTDFQIISATTLAQALKGIEKWDPDVILLDLGLPDSQGFDTLKSVVDHFPNLPVVVITGHDDDNVARDSIKKGAQDYIIKGTFTPELIENAIHYAIVRKSNENELTAIYENAPFLIFLVDNRFIIRRLNKKAIEFSGKTIECLKNSGLGNVLGCAHIDPVTSLCNKIQSCQHCRLQTMLEQVLKTGNSIKKQDVCISVRGNPDLEHLYLSVSIARVSLKGQLFLMLTLEDITDRKMAEKRLRESEAFKDRMIESSRDCICLLDLKGRITYMSQWGMEKYGIKTPELYQNSFWVDLWRLQDRKLVRKAIDDALAGDVGKFRAVSQTRTGTRLWWDVMISPISDADGHVEQLLVISRDVTEQVRIQNRFMNAQKLESIGILAGGIAHDFNNILSSIIGFTELSLDEAEPGSLLEDNLQEVYQAANRARELVHQILTFARQTDDEVQPIRMAPIVKEAVKLIRASIPAMIKIRKEIDSNAKVMSNPGYLQQITMNLFNNAIQAMGHEGVLEVTLRDVMLDRQFVDNHPDLKPGNYVKMTVSDTGKGIEKQHLDSVFSPYFTTKPRKEGAGLGLAVIYGIVKAAGGEITVESQLGKGSTFTVYLPVVEDEDNRHRQRQADNGQAAGSGRVMVVDDEESILKMIRRILQDKGYQVTTFGSSIEAFNEFQANPMGVDLVITDMTMPELSGDKLAMEMLNIRPDIPIIMISGYSDQISEQEAGDIGIKAYAMKPFTKSDFLQTVRDVLDNN